VRASTATREPPPLPFLLSAPGGVGDAHPGLSKPPGQEVHVHQPVAPHPLPRRPPPFGGAGQQEGSPGVEVLLHELAVLQLPRGAHVHPAPPRHARPRPAAGAAVVAGRSPSRRAAGRALTAFTVAGGRALRDRGPQHRRQRGAVGVLVPAARRRHRRAPRRRQRRRVPQQPLHLVGQRGDRRAHVGLKNLAGCRGQEVCGAHPAAGVDQAGRALAGGLHDCEPKGVVQGRVHVERGGGEYLPHLRRAQEGTHHHASGDGRPQARPQRGAVAGGGAVRGGGGGLRRGPPRAAHQHRQAQAVQGAAPLQLGRERHEARGLLFGGRAHAAQQVAPPRPGSVASQCARRL
jgi:hypothetical protein